jgi:HD-GYP domain-containing protein (c-di-GMP phosphodiesterase class II)
MGDACVVYHGTGAAPSDFGVITDVEQRTVTLWRSVAQLLVRPAPDDHAAVLIADSALLAQVGELREVPAHVVILAADAGSAAVLGHRVDVSLVGVRDPVARARVLDAACRLAWSQFHAARLQHRIARTDDEFHELNRIGMALVSERDRSALLTLIVTNGKQLTESDGAGMVALKTDEDGTPRLFSVAYTIDTLPNLGLPQIGYPIDDTSIVGHAALIKKPVVVDDARALPYEASYVASEEFQQRYQYRVRSMLAVPMLSPRDELLGVLLFINRKSDPKATIKTLEDADRYVLPYTDQEVRLACSLASQAAVSMENARLYHQVEHMLEGVVKASVSAIDARDPTTAGHSLRVAALATGLAEAVDRTGRGPYRDLRFTRAQLRELRFAALLHDLGKVTVREDVLVKAKKLSPVLWERVTSRFDVIRRTIQLDYCARRVELCRPGGGDEADSARLEAELSERLRELDRMREIVRAANEPMVVDEPASAALADIAKRTFRSADGSATPFLSADELHFLQLPRGTLDRRERAEVERHVEGTYQFLAQIPWTDDLKNLATYAYGHHEKLNGTGYPRRLRGDDIPIQTRMITLADIFDALTEADRPYKPAVAPERALDIIREEAEAGLLDRDLVEIMMESQAYRRIIEQDWRQL